VCLLLYKSSWSVLLLQTVRMMGVCSYVSQLSQNNCQRVGQEASQTKEDTNKKKTCEERKSNAGEEMF
jgi:hypothetical protein